MNGWFATVSPSGDIAAGNAGIATIQHPVPQTISPVGLKPVWAGSTLVYSLGEAPPGRTKVGDQFVPKAYNNYRGSEDTRWAGFETFAIDLYDGTTLTQHVPNAFNPRFWNKTHVGWITTGDATGHNRQLVLDDMVQARGTILDFVVPSEGNWAVYQIATDVTPYTRGLIYGAERVEIRSDEAPFVGFNFAGQPWILTQTGLPGGVTFVRPVFSSQGYAIHGILNNPDAKLIDGQLLVVGSNESGLLRQKWIDFTDTRQELRGL